MDAVLAPVKLASCFWDIPRFAYIKLAIRSSERYSRARFRLIPVSSAFRRSAFVKSTSDKSAPDIFDCLASQAWRLAPFKLLPSRLEWHSLAPVKSALTRVARSKLAWLRLASRRLAESKLAPLRSADVNSETLKSAAPRSFPDPPLVTSSLVNLHFSSMLAFCILVLSSHAMSNVASVRSAPVKLASSRLAFVRLAWCKLASRKSAPFKKACPNCAPDRLDPLKFA